MPQRRRPVDEAAISGQRRLEPRRPTATGFSSVRRVRDGILHSSRTAPSAWAVVRLRPPSATAIARLPESPRRSPGCSRHSKPAIFTTALLPIEDDRHHYMLAGEGYGILRTLSQTTGGGAIAQSEKALTASKSGRLRRVLRGHFAAQRRSLRGGRWHIRGWAAANFGGVVMRVIEQEWRARSASRKRGERVCRAEARRYRNLAGGYRRPQLASSAENDSSSRRLRGRGRRARRVTASRQARRPVATGQHEAADGNFVGGRCSARLVHTS